ncbi:hypothetical protein [Actinophytocola oryzae]|uniref:Uncharacterized protein n=1 Tax=Actinophytocola oryzae TaxID=502181 RepID=A0A4R7VRG1_9PSEU|nr:hypothetical protein [Actinophytocola oryzae]TDV52242.1 hypothetical protein CLV71_105374 [Actinophytocola oryzae]
MESHHVADWAPRSQASKPIAFPPHPPLQSGGWYHGTTIEVAGPGRPAVSTPSPKSATTAVLLSLLFGPLGLCYLSVTGGLVATVVTVAVLGWAGAGFLPLLFLWPLAVAVAVYGSRL